MKVAVLTQYFPTSGQPWAGHSAYQTLRLLATKCDVHVFYPRAMYPPLLRRGKPAAFDYAWNPPGVAITYIPYPVLPVLSRPVNGWMIGRRLLPAIQEYKPDILLNYVIYPDGYAAIQIAKALRIPAVLTAIGSDLNRIAPFCGPQTRSTLRNADFITTVSNDLCQTARRLGAEPLRSRAKLNGCDTAVFYPMDRMAARQELGLESDAEIILYVGRLDVRKGLLELVEAMGRLRELRPRTQCFLLGDGPDRGVIQEAIGREKLEDRVRLIPSCVTAGVARWMAAADLVTLPSYNEGCPNVVLEALSAGRPVVATRVGGIPELMDERSGRLVAAKDVAALTDALNDTLERPWSATEIAARHSRSWGDVASDLYSILTGVLNPEQMPTDSGAFHTAHAG